MRRLTVLLGLGMIIALNSMSRADIPKLINFQGILKDVSGNPVADGSYSVIFTIYDDPSAGNVLWAETTSVSTTSGLFTALLGSANPIPDSAFQDTARYLGVKVGADPEMTPRQKLVSVGYAYESAQWTSAAQNLFRLNGNVGIGTTSPAAKLHVDSGDVFIGSIPTPALSFPAENLYVGNSIGDPKNSLRIDGWLNDFAIIASSSPGAAAGASISFRTATAGAFELDRMRISPAGNVGIGTNAPVNRLDVEGGAAIGASYSGTNTAPANGLLVQGNVGIGTASPAAQLHVHDPSGTINGSRLMLTQTATGSTIFDGTALICGSPNRAFLWNYENGPSIFGTNNAERMRIDSTGRVGIGTASPLAKLHVNGEAEGLRIQGTGVGGPGGAYASFYDAAGTGIGYVGDGSSSDQDMYVTSYIGRVHLYTPVGAALTAAADGNVGIGTTTPTTKLHVVGVVLATGGYSSSDARYKTNLHEIPDALNKVKDLHGIFFNWKRDEFPAMQFKKGNQIGFVAQELKEVLPEAVFQGSDGYYSVDYGRLTPLLVEAIKEQQKQIEELKEEILKLKKETYQAQVKN